MPRGQPSIARLAAVLLSLVVAVTILCTWTLVIALQGDDGLLAQYDAARAIKGALSRDGDGAPVVSSTGDLDGIKRSFPGLWYVVTTKGGNVYYGAVPASVRDGDMAAPDASAFLDSGDALRLTNATVVTRLGGEFVRIQVGGAAYTPAQAALSSLRDVNYTAIPILAVVVATILVALITVPALIARPVRRVSHSAERIDGGSDGIRLPLEEAPRELVPMVAAFNRALERIDVASAAQRRFLSNAAHELRTPLTRVRTGLERVEDAHLRRSLVADIQSLSSTVTMLLQIARLSSDSPEMRRFDLVAAVRATTAEHVPAALAAGVDVAFFGECDAVLVIGSETAARIAAGNLLRNALQHARSGKSVLVEVRSPGTVRVIDHGDGVRDGAPAEMLQPFARGQASDGTGLGLALVAQVMAMHGGSVAMDETPGGGLTVSLMFPGAAA
ncbi:sensor histidine kinase [Methylobacterium sp. SyP6R]|uniref:sensor histidine kinase n=1 Tax=Methylobacterium sp. SyP6R TaxID=2718876 RepID=UPI001F2EFA25|nr:HAMP domain-containing sensor histidine kinase [Methylobacterium sp. SyP6R]MCF4129568.1 HAMP domain-containing histidine kinase [Methylobacterium sp. SyP6R]